MKLVKGKKVLLTNWIFGIYRGRVWCIIDRRATIGFKMVSWCRKICLKVKYYAGVVPWYYRTTFRCHCEWYLANL